MATQRPIISKLSKPLPSGIYLGELLIQWKQGSRVCRIAYRSVDGSVYEVGKAPRAGATMARALIDKTMRDIIDPLLAAEGDFSHKSRLQMARKAYHLGTATGEPLEPMLEKLDQGRMMK